MLKSLLMGLAISLVTVSAPALAQKKQQAASCEAYCNQRCSSSGSAAGHCTAKCIPYCHQTRASKK